MPSSPARLLLKQVGLEMTLEGAQGRIWCSEFSWQTVPCLWSINGEAALTGSSPGARDQQSPRRRDTTFFHQTGLYVCNCGIIECVCLRVCRVASEQCDLQRYRDALQRQRRTRCGGRLHRCLHQTQKPLRLVDCLCCSSCHFR